MNHDDVIAGLLNLREDEQRHPSAGYTVKLLTAAIALIQAQRDALAAIWQLDAEVNGEDGHGIGCDQRYCMGLSRAADIIDRAALAEAVR